jgi:hypothetical protein
MLLNLGCGDFIDEDFNEGTAFVGIDSLDAFSGEGENYTIEKKLVEFKKCVVDNYEDQAPEILRRFVVADARQLPFKDKVFDTVFSCRFIGRYPESFSWREVDRVLQEGGIVDVRLADDAILDRESLADFLQYFNRFEVECTYLPGKKELEDGDPIGLQLTIRR